MMKLIVLALIVTQIAAKKKIPDDDATDDTEKRMIKAGTLWCGHGSKAKSYDELGRLADLDSCCREHDQCDRYVPAFSKRYSYFNMRPYTVSDCKCDSTFYKCLKDVKENAKEAGEVGKLFFNTLGGFPCLKFDASGKRATKGHSPSY